MADLAGRTLGKYQVIERLGRGGMADVYKAYQPGLERYVAIKVMHSHLSDDVGFIERFQREAKAVAGLRHPNIVQVFDFDVQDGSYYMVMEYVEGGQSLKEVLADLSMAGERLALATTLDITAKLADALDYAHSRDMIHRDIKPGNVLVPTLESPLLSDFGIARLLDQSGLTASGAMIGTPAYMSPEQGRGEPVDTRSDIYALGIMLYEMLVSRPPYDADTPYGVILKHINDPLVSPRVLDPSLPESVERIVLKALAKDRNARYESAGKMRDALQQALYELADSTQSSQATPAAGIFPEDAETIRMGGIEPTLQVPRTQGETKAASPAGTAPATSLPPQKKSRWWIWALAAVVVVAILAVGGLAISGVLGGGLSAALPGGDDGGGGIVDQAADRPSNEQPANDQPAAGQPNEYDELAQQGWERLYEGNGDVAMPVFIRVLRDKPDNAKALAGQGIVEIWRGANPAAVESIRAAVNSEENSPYAQFANAALHHWGSLYSPDIAMEAYNRAFDTCGEDRQLCAWILHERSQLRFWDLEQRDEGVADMRMSIELTDDRYQRGDAMTILADFLFVQGQIDEALATYKEAYNQSDPGDQLWILDEGTVTALRAGRYDVATQFMDQALADSNGDPPYVVGRSFVALEAGDIDQAIALSDRALELDTRLLPAYYVKGLIAIKTEQYPEALDRFAAIVEREGDWYAHWENWMIRPDTGHELYFDMGRAAYLSGDLDRATGLLQRSLEHNDGWADPYLLLGDVFRDGNNLGAAREQYLHVIDMAYDNPDLQAVAQERIAALTQ